eukprot:8353967-Pyramimonas_sp.AAC.1
MGCAARLVTEDAYAAILGGLVKIHRVVMLGRKFGRGTGLKDGAGEWGLAVGILKRVRILLVAFGC